MPDVLAAVARGGAPAALMAAVPAVFGPPRGRHEARRLQRRLVDSGVVVPDWLESLGAVVLARAVRPGDAWDDECAVLVDWGLCR